MSDSKVVIVLRWREWQQCQANVAGLEEDYNAVWLPGTQQATLYNNILHISIWSGIRGQQGSLI